MNAEETSGDISTEHYVDPVIEAYKKDVDRTLIREMLKLSVQQRIERLEAAVKDVQQLQQAMKTAKASQ